MNASKTAAWLKGPPHTGDDSWRLYPWSSLSFPAIATAYITWGRDFVNLVTSGASWDCMFVYYLNQVSFACLFILMPPPPPPSKRECFSLEETEFSTQHPVWVAEIKKKGEKWTELRNLHGDQCTYFGKTRRKQGKENQKKTKAGKYPHVWKDWPVCPWRLKRSSRETLKYKGAKICPNQTEKPKPSENTASRKRQLDECTEYSIISSQLLIRDHGRQRWGWHFYAA